MRVLPIVVLAAVASAADPWELSAGAGASGIFETRQRPWATLEARPPWRLMGFGLWAAGAGGPDDAWLGAGCAGEAHFGGRVWIRPGFGAGWYGGDGLRLGHPIEFRSSIEVGWELPRGPRLGLVISHFSNARLGRENPGAEVGMLTLAVPLR